MATRIISGTVTNTYGEPLIEATISFKGSKFAETATGRDGRYALSVNQDNKFLEFYYVGYNTNTVPIGSENVIDVTLDDHVELDDVVVT